MRKLSLLAATVSLAIVMVGCGGASNENQERIPGTVITASGLQYQDLRVGAGYSPDADDVVQVDYVAYLNDGTTKVGSSYDPGGAPLEYSVGHKITLDGKAAVIDGVQEAIRGMRVGGQRRLVIPPDLAYGHEGLAPTVPPDSTLIYYVDLKNVIKPDTPDEGLYTYDLQEGYGQAAQSGDKLRVNYTGWTYSDVEFDSSLNPGREPFEYTLGAGEVIQGWDLGMVGLKVGGKRRLLISPNLGYGEEGSGELIPPNTWLIFNVELLEIVPP